jgi:hypothetical protein
MNIFNKIIELVIYGYVWILIYIEKAINYILNKINGK